MPISETAPFKLTPAQRKANKLLGQGQRHTLMVGGSRSGKTFLLTRAVVVRALRSSGSRHAILRLRAAAIRPSIGRDTLPKVMKLCFPDVPYKENKQEGFFQFPNNSEIWLSGLDDKDRVEKILGQEYATIYLNECSQIPWSSVLVAQTRLAQTPEGIEQRAYYDLNPTSTEHWTYELFLKDRMPGTKMPLEHPEHYAYQVMNPADNAANLSEAYIESLKALPKRQRRRFYEGMYVSELENALWTLDLIERNRVGVETLEGIDLRRVVVAIDPSGAAGREDYRSDEIGIIVAGVGSDGHGYVLADRTLRDGPSVWGRIAVEAFDEFQADRFVAEKNFGGAMVESVIQMARNYAPVTLLTASRGKAVRAEPVSALYEQDRVHHVGHFAELEDQMANFTTAGYVGERSPDRADALVWALSHLMVENIPGNFDFNVDQFSHVAELESAGSPWDYSL